MFGINRIIRMRIERKARIVSSGRNFFPKGAFFYSTKKVAELASEVGYEGVEFLPTWRFVWEMQRYGRLLAPKEMIVSGHRDWRLDRVMDPKNAREPVWLRQIKDMADWVSPPPTSLCLTVLKKFQRIYKVPISTIWFSDTKNFSPVMLEIYNQEQGIDQEGLIKWLKQNSKARGVVFDTRKFSYWSGSNNLENKREKVVGDLLPYILEVHFRSKSDWKRQNVSDDSEKNLRSVIKAGFSGRIVVEFGWPDLYDSPFGLFNEDLRAFKNLHRNIISFIKSI